MSNKRIFLLIVACLALTAIASAQELQSGAIRGRVIDDSGQPLPGVSITISGPAHIGKVPAVTNADGYFRAPSMTPGSGYEIRVDLAGFETILQTGIIARSERLSIKLRELRRPSVNHRR